MKKFLITTALVLSFSSSFALDNKHSMDSFISKEAHDKILLLSFSDPKIQAIPIKDNGEEIIDAFKMNNPRILDIDKIPNSRDALAILPTCFKSDQHGLMRKELYQRLEKMLEYLPSDVGIAYISAYWNRHFSKELFEIIFHRNLNAGMSKEVAYEEASQLMFSPLLDTPQQTTGGAIDITLFKIDAKGHKKLLNLGILGSRNINHDIDCFSEKITPEQKKNRKMLMEAATKAGLVGYEKKWWSYHYGNQIWAYVTGAPHAIYGLFNEKDKELSAKWSKMTKEEYLNSIKNEIQP
jgi:D-alanyl-D-alanine dipeptidase